MNLTVMNIIFMVMKRYFNGDENRFNDHENTF